MNIRVLGWLAAAALCGCAGDADHVAKPPMGAVTLAVGQIAVEQPEWAYAARRFRRALIADLKKSGAFARVLDGAPRSIAGRDVVLEGALLRIDGGSDALRFAIGLGAPSAAVGVEVEDAHGEKLRVVRSADPILGPSSPDVDAMIDDLAKDVAEAVARWKKKGAPESALF